MTICCDAAISKMAASRLGVGIFKFGGRLQMRTKMLAHAVVEVVVGENNAAVSFTVTDAHTNEVIVQFKDLRAYEGTIRLNA